MNIHFWATGNERELLPLDFPTTQVFRLTQGVIYPLPKRGDVFKVNIRDVVFGNIGYATVWNVKRIARLKKYHA